MNSKFVVKGYQVVSKIAEQGMRASYQATHLRSGKGVVLNTIKVRPGKTQELLLVRAKQSKKCLIPELVKAVDFGIIKEDLLYYSELDLAKKHLKEVLDEPLSPRKQIFRFMLYDNV